MAEDETTELQESEPADTGFFGTGSIYGPGGSYGKTQEEMWKGVQTSADVATAATAAPAAVRAAAQKQVGVIKGAHQNALVAARQALAQRAMQGMRRGRSTAGNIQAAGTLGKQAATEYSTMASQQAADIGAVELAAEKEAIGLDVLAAQAWDEANTAAQTYWGAVSEMSQTATDKFKTDLDAALISISNVGGGDAAGTIQGFDAAWNQADTYMDRLDPQVSEHVVAAEAFIMELLSTAPQDLGVPTPYIKHIMPQLFQAFGLAGAMTALAGLVHHMSAGMTATLPSGETMAVPMTPWHWEQMIKYMIENGVNANELPDWAQGADNMWVLGG